MFLKMADLKFDDSVPQPMSRDRGVNIADFLFGVFFLDCQTAKLKTPPIFPAIRYGASQHDHSCDMIVFDTPVATAYLCSVPLHVM